MKQFDEEKLKQLKTADQLLDEKYGKQGTKKRNKFEADARAYYYGVILRDRRKELKMTQQQLANEAGVQRSYISRIEKGATDIQLSSFIRLISAMKLTISIE